MPLSKEEVRWVAHLARLELSAGELETMGRQLSDIVAYVEQLASLDTASVEPLAHPLPVSNMFRDDVPAPSLPVERALANAPCRRGDFYAVPAVLE
jgi:aspartyl-tRNA(Asn)/glutamyl-tRNA(Gln) amidotransferase subunit C